MTKPWELHEATIKQLYAEKTLSQVRNIMIERHNFKASTRAYRGRLDKWGIRKYNCRRRSEGGSVSTGSPEGSLSGSDTASPTLSQHNVESPNSASYHAGRRTGDDESGISNVLGRSYSTMDMDTHRTDTGQ
ncbi:Clr5 domain-containing protein [Xylaria cf. heliscus]|nr:Clr5 domain-containing protein [Xylaria cf. heliscus]